MHVYILHVACVLQKNDECIIAWLWTGVNRKYINELICHLDKILTCVEVLYSCSAETDVMHGTPRIKALSLFLCLLHLHLSRSSEYWYDFMSMYDILFFEVQLRLTMKMTIYINSIVFIMIVMTHSSSASLIHRAFHLRSLKESI